MYNNSYSGANAGAVASALGVWFGCIALIAIIFIALQVWLFWRILEKAGLSPWLALISLVGGLGTLVLLFILALSEWPSLRHGASTYIPPTTHGGPPAPTYQPAAPTPGYQPPPPPMNAPAPPAYPPPAPPAGQPPA